MVSVRDIVLPVFGNLLDGDGGEVGVLPVVVADDLKKEVMGFWMKGPMPLTFQE